MADPNQVAKVSGFSLKEKAARPIVGLPAGSPVPYSFLNAWSLFFRPEYAPETFIPLLIFKTSCYAFQFEYRIVQLCSGQWGVEI